MQPHENPENYKLSIFYYNPADTRFMVPRRNGLGWTFNFANYSSWLVMAMILGIFIWRLIKDA